MILHYNIYPDRDHALCEHLVWFHFGDCAPVDMIALVPYITSCVDKSVGIVFYSDWDWLAEQGTIRMRGAVGCPQETLAAVCDKIVSDIRDILDIEPCTYCPRKK